MLTVYSVEIEMIRSVERKYSEPAHDGSFYCTFGACIGDNYNDDTFNDHVYLFTTSVIDITDIYGNTYNTYSLVFNLINKIVNKINSRTIGFAETFITPMTDRIIIEEEHLWHDNKMNNPTCPICQGVY